MFPLLMGNACECTSLYTSIMQGAQLVLGRFMQEINTTRMENKNLSRCGRMDSDNPPVRPGGQRKSHITRVGTAHFWQFHMNLQINIYIYKWIWQDNIHLQTSLPSFLSTPPQSLLLMFFLVYYYSKICRQVRRSPRTGQ